MFNEAEYVVKSFRMFRPLIFHANLQRQLYWSFKHLLNKTRKELDFGQFNLAGELNNF